MQPVGEEEKRKGQETVKIPFVYSAAIVNSFTLSAADQSGLSELFTIQLDPVVSKRSTTILLSTRANTSRPILISYRLAIAL